MLSEIFYWLFNMSIVASVSGLIVLLLRMIKGIPRRVIKVLWIIPFIRFWVPIGISGKYGLMTLISKFTTKTVTVFQLSDNQSFSMMNGVMGANSYFPITYKVNLLEKVFDYSSAVWVVICSAIVLTLIILSVATASETKDAVPYMEKSVYLSDKFTSPAVFGIIKPKILIPTGYDNFDKSNIEYVLKHERAHIKSGDNLLRIIAFITAALHWFNPLVWLFLKCFLSDLEYACDEKILSRLNMEERRQYAGVLVDCSGNRNVFVSAFGGAKLRTRVERILSYKKLSAFSTVLFTVLVMVIAYVLLTNAA